MRKPTRKDIFSRRKRSLIMSSIKSKNTGPELKLKRAMKRFGLRFKMHADLPGTPDFAFPDKKLALFCHGDFWHGFNYEKTRPRLDAFWRAKIEGNIRRDARVRKRLNRLGWKTIAIRASRIEKNPEDCVKRISNKLDAI